MIYPELQQQMIRKAFCAFFKSIIRAAGKKKKEAEKKDLSMSRRSMLLLVCYCCIHYANCGIIFDRYIFECHAELLISNSAKKNTSWLVIMNNGTRIHCKVYPVSRKD